MPIVEHLKLTQRGITVEYPFNGFLRVTIAGPRTHSPTDNQFMLDRPNVTDLRDCLTKAYDILWPPFVRTPPLNVDDDETD